MYRIKQFIWGIKSLYKRIDEEFIERFLTRDEIIMFKKLKINDQHHCIRVCKDALNTNENFELNIDEYKLGKAALLHDIGKITLHLNLLEKSIIVILDKLTSGYTKKFNNVKQINIYYNHPQIGYDILKDKGYSIELLEVVRDHHKKYRLKDNEYLTIIAFCDDRN